MRTACSESILFHRHCSELRRRRSRSRDWRWSSIGFGRLGRRCLRSTMERCPVGRNQLTKPGRLHSKPLGERNGDIYQQLPHETPTTGKFALGYSSESSGTKITSSGYEAANLKLFLEVDSGTRNGGISLIPFSQSASSWDACAAIGSSLKSGNSISKEPSGATSAVATPLISSPLQLYMRISSVASAQVHAIDPI